MLAPIIVTVICGLTCNVDHLMTWTWWYLVTIHQETRKPVLSSSDDLNMVIFDDHTPGDEEARPVIWWPEHGDIWWSYTRRRGSPSCRLMTWTWWYLVTIHQETRKPVLSSSDDLNMVIFDDHAPGDEEARPVVIWWPEHGDIWWPYTRRRGSPSCRLMTWSWTWWYLVIIHQETRKPVLSSDDLNMVIFGDHTPGDEEARPVVWWPEHGDIWWSYTRRRGSPSCRLMTWTWWYLVIIHQETRKPVLSSDDLNMVIFDDLNMVIFDDHTPGDEEARPVVVSRLPLTSDINDADKLHQHPKPSSQRYVFSNALRQSGHVVECMVQINMVLVLCFHGHGWQ